MAAKISLVYGLGSMANAENSTFKMHESINSPFKEISPVLATDGSLLFFCREGDPQNVGYRQRKHDQDIWLSRRQGNGTFGPAEHIDAPFNTTGYDFPVAFFSDTQTLYVGNAYSSDGKSKPGISKSQLLDGKFSFPEALIIEDFYNEVNLVSYSVSTDQKILIMSLQRKDTRGKSDLYASFLKGDGKWTRPKNLGDDLNSADSELTPHLADDSRTLYFASNREGGYGSFDIYVARREDDSFTKWSTPTNLGRKFNSKASDVTLTLTSDGTQALLAVDIAPGNKDFQIKTIPENLRPIKPKVISGTVADLDGNALEANVLAEKLGGETIVARARSSLPDGKFSIMLVEGTKYGLHAEKENYAPVSVSIDLTKRSTNSQPVIRLTLVPLEAGSKIRLNNVFFASNSAQLSKISHSELNRLVLLMKANASLKIEIGGHTDNVGSAGANQKLSARRAASVRNYLLAQGIAASRISARGYGTTKPSTSNATAKGRSLNRRVEFSILGI